MLVIHLENYACNGRASLPSLGQGHAFVLKHSIALHQVEVEPRQAPTSKGIKAFVQAPTGSGGKTHPPPLEPISRDHNSLKI
jgi:hypothetical protein